MLHVSILLHYKMNTHLEIKYIFLDFKLLYTTENHYLYVFFLTGNKGGTNGSETISEKV